MPCTTTQNTIGATIIEISFKKASLKILRLMAKSGTAMPSTIPSSSAARTWTNSDVYSGFRATGAAADMVDIGHPQLVPDIAATNVPVDPYDIPTSPVEPMARDAGPKPLIQLKR
jgi:hypothetical protein